MSQPVRGRPRDASARAAAIQVTREILQSHGYEGLSLDEVAARAGVGKQSLYRWWGSKSELIVQTVLDGFSPSPPRRPPTTSDIRADLRAIVDSVVSGMRDPHNAPLIRALATVAATDADAAAVLWDRFTGPTRLAITDRLASGVAAGELRAGFSPDVASEAIIGAGLFLILARREIPLGYGEELLELLLNGVAIDRDLERKTR